MVKESTALSNARKTMDEGLTMKVRKIFNMQGGFASYNYYNDEIYYDQRLDNYPRLKEKILLHELKHAEHKNNFAYHIWHDIVDNIIFLDKEFYEYYVLEKDLPKTSVGVMIMFEIYNIFGVIRPIIALPFTILSTVIWSIRGLIKR
jgi:hypothetical protein